MSEEITRREFVRRTAAGTALLAGTTSGALGMAASALDNPSHQVVAALGKLLIPSDPGSPGYKDLEQYGITNSVMKNLLGGKGSGGEGEGGQTVQKPAGGVDDYVKNERGAPAPDQKQPTAGMAVVAEFNDGAKLFFNGKTFLELDENRQGQYLELVAGGSKITDEKQRVQLQTFYRAARARILTVYYQNYPDNEVKRNAEGAAILKLGDTHQITNPHTTKVVTGWDICGFKGPLGWEEEEQRRAMMKKQYAYWFEGDLVKRNNVTAAPAIKTSDGKDYYDAVVVGGGTAGCIVAGRLAERGINPKTGDRLKVAMIEGGSDWTIRDAGIRPGYGAPIRRQYIANVNYGERNPETPSPEYQWYFGGENFKLVGGCSTHYGGACYVHTEDDFNIFRQTSEVNWTYGEFEQAIEEFKEMYHVSSLPEETWCRAAKMFQEAGRAMGYDVQLGQQARRNCIDSAYCGDGHLCRYDAKGTSLPWAYIGLNNGLKVIADAEVEKIIIEKPVGAAPVATGVVYKDKSGTMHEIRAARIIVACGNIGTPVLLFKSGYGPSELLGTNLIVENKNVGANLDGDVNSAHITAYFPEPIRETRGGSGAPVFTPQPHPWGELTFQVRPSGMNREIGNRYPHSAALSPFAPELGRKHKEWMREGWLRLGMIADRLQVLPWSWRVLPDCKVERVSIDEAKINAAAKEAAELTYSLFDKMSPKPLQVDKRPILRATSLRPDHASGSARAGSRRENSVCNSDFDCHDIDHLMFTSLAAMPRTTFCHGGGPAAQSGSYAYRKFLKNHFSKGSSTKGFA